MRKGTVKKYPANMYLKFTNRLRTAYGLQARPNGAFMEIDKMDKELRSQILNTIRKQENPPGKMDICRLFPGIEKTVFNEINEMIDEGILTYVESERPKFLLIVEDF